MSTTIPLTLGYVATIDEDDSPCLESYKWSASKTPSGCYARSVKRGRRIYMHRLIMGVLDDLRVEVDHINGNTMDNRKANLRVCFPQQNDYNRKTYSSNTSGFKGVTWSKEKGIWVSRINVNGRRIHLGYFNNPEAAYHAYRDAASHHFGKFVRIEHGKAQTR